MFEVAFELGLGFECARDAGEGDQVHVFACEAAAAERAAGGFDRAGNVLAEGEQLFYDLLERRARAYRARRQVAPGQFTATRSLEYACAALQEQRAALFVIA